MGATNDYETRVQTALSQVPCPWPSRRTLHGSFDADGFSTLWVRVKLTVSQSCLQIWLVVRKLFLHPFLHPSFHGDTKGGDAKCRLFSQAAEIEPWNWNPGFNYNAKSRRTPYTREVQLQLEGFLIVSSSLIYDDVGWWLKVPVSLWTASRFGVRGLKRASRRQGKKWKRGSVAVMSFLTL